MVLTLIALRSATYAAVARASLAAPEQTDFGIFYRSAVAAAKGDNPYRLHNERAPNLNPPQMIVLMLPLARLPEREAFIVWMAASACSAVLALIITCYQARLSTLKCAFVVALVLCGAPTGVMALTGQVSWLLWGPLQWSWARMRRNTWTISAIVLGILVSLKLFLALLLPLLWIHKQYRPLLAAVIATAAMYVVGIAALGHHVLLAWLKSLSSVTWTGQILNVSLLGFWTRTLSPTHPSAWPTAPVVNAPTVVPLAWLLSAAFVIVISFRAVWSYQHARGEMGSRATVDGQWCVLLAAAVLVSPLGWNYYLFFLIGPFASLWNAQMYQMRSWRLGLAAIAVGGFLLSPWSLTFAQPAGIATASVGSMYFWSLCCLWFTASRTPMRKREVGAHAL